MHEILIAGFGGQGVMFLGTVLAQAAVREDREVTWLPSYGPEMRGGTAHCTVVISDDPIASPVVAEPSVLVALNRPSLDMFGPAVRPGGLILWDRTVAGDGPGRRDVEAVGVPATAVAHELGSTRAANIVLLGALLAHRPIVQRHTVDEVLSEMVADDAARSRNLAALERGLTAGPSPARIA